MIRFLAVAFILLVPEGLFAQGWIEYVSRNDFFSINFPGQPTVQDIVWTSEQETKYPGRVYMIENGPNRYAITVVDYSDAERLNAERAKNCPSDAQTACSGSATMGVGLWIVDLQGAMLYAIAKFMTREGARVTFFGWFYQDLIEGLQAQITNVDGSRTFVATHMHDNRLYVLELTVPRGAPQPGHFQQSLQFLDADGKTIRYETGALEPSPAAPPQPMNEIPMRTLVTVVVSLLVGASAHAEESVSAAACERLAASLKLPNTTVTAANPVAAGRFTPPGGSASAAQAAAGLPAFCRVSLTIKPSSDSDIRSEVWLPMAGWNGKFMALGNGAWGGSIQYAALAETLQRGYAAASTDTGHTGTDASFAVGHPEKLIDFGYRAVHETAVQGKATVRALYGTAPRMSYFNGCSGGGRQSFMEAQRFPEDFDGIIAGAPGYNRTDAAFQTIQMIQATHKDAASFIPASKLPALHQAAINACDSQDGLKDGLISEPAKCQFDPGVIACKSADGPSCLTMPQVVAARAIYAPVIDPRTKQEVSTGLEPGSELHWDSVAGNQPHSMYNDLLRFIVFKDPNWDYRTLDVAKHLDLARKADAGILLADSTDLKPFVSRGGKLLIYHGWEDQNIPPLSSVNYYTKLVATMGNQQADSAVRLYMVPGMGHCGGGDGPSVFDMVAALEQWREQGRAPAEILASKVQDGRAIRTRPLCPYPQIARYKGSGSIDKAESFSCQAP